MMSVSMNKPAQLVKLNERASLFQAEQVVNTGFQFVQFHKKKEPPIR